MRAGYSGLAGVRLRSFVTTGALGSGSCAQNGCYGVETTNTPSQSSHPLTSQVTTWPFWP